MKKGFVILGILLISGLFVFVEGVSAVPSIGSAPVTISDGETLVITGTGFGAKTTATPILFENFENGSSGTQIKGRDCSHYGSWQDYSFGNVPVYSNENQRPGSILSSKHILSSVSSNNCPLLTTLPAGIGPNQKVLISFWGRWDEGTGTGSTWNIKWWRLEDPDNPGWDWVYIQGGSLGGSEGISMRSSSGNVGDNWDFNPTLPDDSWLRFTLEIQTNSADGSSDGSIVCYTDYNDGGIIKKNNFFQSDFNAIKFFNDSTERWQNLKFGWWVGNSQSSPSGAEWYFDDIYFDITWQRVEIGDSNIYANCTHREIQPPTLWADGSITIDVNQGSFVDGEDVYLFVVDENGDVSNGFLVTLGDGLSNCGQADSNPVDDVVSITELINYISSWKAGDVLIGELINAIGEWKNGC